MTFTYVGEIGTANEKADPADSSISMTVTSSVSSGALVVVRVVTDNITTSDGPSTDHGIADSQGNSYTRIVEYTMDDGGAGTGVTTSLHYSVLTTGLTDAVDTITATTGLVTAKGIGAHEFGTAGIAGSGGSGSTGAGNSPSTTISSLTERDYLWLGQPGWEGKTSETLAAEDADYQDFTYATYIGTNAASPTSNVASAGAYRISTATTGDTYAPTLGTSRDYAQVLGYLWETAVAATNVVNAVISNA